MFKLWIACLVAWASLAARAAEALIVADEFPAMEVLAARLKLEENLPSRIVSQTNMPKDLSAFEAVAVYVHRDLKEAAESALLSYADKGGKLVLLHHSISSGKRKNKQWFPSLGVDLLPGDVAAGGYKWIEGVTLDIVCLPPGHFITTNKVNYPSQVRWTLPDEPGSEKALPGFTLEHSEVYINHTLTSPRTRLLGYRFNDTKSGKVWTQTHAGWIKPLGKGWLVYLMPGHGTLDFENPAYARIVINAMVWKP